MPSRYVPDTGDIICLDFDPSAGREQAGHRPALVLSPKIYNGEKMNLLICVPVTSQVKGYPFEVDLKHKSIEGVALADQVKSIDWKVRNAKKKAKVSNEVVNEVRKKIKLLMQIT